LDVGVGNISIELEYKKNTEKWAWKEISKKSIWYCMGRHASNKKNFES
jgi:hypothetical protein